MSVKETEKNGIGHGTPGPGRPKGVPNKTTQAVKEAFDYAFEGMGGADALLEWGKDPAHQSDFYKLYARMLPKPLDLSGDIGIKATLVINNG